MAVINQYLHIQTRKNDMGVSDVGEVAAAVWPLKSGRWVSFQEQGGFELKTTALGHPAAELSPLDTRLLFGSGYSRKYPDVAFPPEFKYSPFDGHLLTQSSVRGISAPGWVAPFGGTPMTDKSSRTLRGLDQTVHPLLLARGRRRAAQEDPDDTLPCPSPGVYDYFSLPLGSPVPTLLAIDPAKGALYVFLEGSREWVQLENDAGGILAESTGDRMDWRCEAVVEGDTSRVFIATSHGLACVVADVAALSFSVVYSKSATLGSPIEFAGYVWAPVVRGSQLQFTSMTRDGQAGPTVDLPQPWTPGGRVCSPLADGRKAIWMMQAGQLILQRTPDGEFVAVFYAWPADTQPSFDFGCPYLSRDGTTWQLCQTLSRGDYLYVQLGSEKPPRQETTTPRFCTGTINYRFAAKLKSEPWVEPEVGVDGAGLVIPVLEHAASDMAVGLRLESTAGLEEVINSAVPWRAVLLLDEASAVTEFYTLALPRPWQLRLVVHGGKLWLSHPQLKYIAGWELQA